jgi:7-carboxy-7-deazaguanine synthase
MKLPLPMRRYALTNKTILETFYSIQGEGLKIGVPSVFIRFPGCNLRCPWCDTKYSWEEKPKLNFEDINIISNEIVFTGGEPLLNQDLILSFISKHPDLNYTIETNGTLIPCSELTDLDIFWSVSPKLFLKDWNKNISIFDNYKTVQFKFVISDLSDLNKLKGLSLRHPILVQPNGQTEDYSKACRELAECVLNNKLNFRVLPQFHKICWQDRRNI